MSSSVPAPQPSDPKSLVEYGYDQIAPRYLAWSAPRPTTTRMHYLEKLISILPAGASCLELGCGAGVPCTQALVARGFAVTGNDISASQIELAKEHVPQATLIQGDMLALDFQQGSFDAVVAFYSIFHLPGQEQGMLVEKVTGWLKEGGWFLFNLATNEGDVLVDDWMGVKMFSSGLGVEGNREMMRVGGKGLKVVEDEVAMEMVGRIEEKFHWVLAQKVEVP